MGPFLVPSTWYDKAVPNILAVPDEFVTLGELLTHTGFMTGLAAGLGVLGLFYAASWATKKSISGWGVAFAGTVLAILALQFEVGPPLFLSFSLLALGGWLVDFADKADASSRAKAGKIFGWLLLGSATLVVVSTDQFPDETWVKFGFPLVVLALGNGVRRPKRPPMSELLGVMFAISVFGVWATVPETDMVTVLLGVSIPLAFATWPPIRARVIGAGAFALVGVITWLTVDGGVARPASIVGGWAAFGLLALIPLVGVHRPLPGKITILGLHVIAVFLASRVFGLWESVVAASIGVVVVALALVMILRKMPMRPENATAAESETEVSGL